jgi:cyclopropane-fatty-acyl-phospholipid synthase
LGNDFYRLFLDEGMQYSCAYFLDDGETLEQAQTNKLRLLATLADVQVVGVTLSREQHLGAVDRAEAAGLSDRVRFELKDYRLVEGRFDRIVSVGMFEHVGVRHYGEFFAKIDAFLTDDGIALVHSIGHMSPPGIASPWLRRYIFPGAYSPSLSEVFEATEKQRLWVTDLEFLRLHYAKTLAHWGRRFEANRDRVIAMYDENFARMWEFYLISAEMMFTTGNQLVFHLQLARKRDAAPLTRDYITDLQRTYRRLESERSGPGNID